MAMKPRVRTAFSGYSQLKFLQLAELIIQCMTGNAYFPTPVPTLTAITAAITAYANALYAPSSKANTAAKKTARTALAILLEQLADYVQATANGSEQKMLSSGIPLAKTPQRRGILPVPDNFKAVPGYAGTVNLSAKKVDGADVYNVTYTNTPVTAESVWETMQSTKVRSFTVNGLQTGKQYAFKIAAVGAATEIVYSDAVTSYAF